MLYLQIEDSRLVFHHSDDHQTNVDFYIKYIHMVGLAIVLSTCI